MSRERELLKRVIEIDDDDSEFFLNGKLEWDIKELLAQPETITPRQGLVEFKKGYMIGYNVAVMDLKQKVDNMFTAILEDDNE